MKYVVLHSKDQIKVVTADAPERQRSLTDELKTPVATNYWGQRQKLVSFNRCDGGFLGHAIQHLKRNQEENK